MLRFIAGFLFILFLGLSHHTVFAQDFRGDPQNGNMIYDQKCARCHGDKGAGDGPEGQYLIVKPSDFHSPHTSAKMDADLFTTIKYGLIFSPMHGWGDRLHDQEISDVIAYIRFLAPFKAYAQAK